VKSARSSKAMPLDAKPDPRGRIVLDAKGDAIVLTMAEAEAIDRINAELDPMAETADRFTSHFATCPEAAQHRRKP